MRFGFSSAGARMFRDQKLSLGSSRGEPTGHERPQKRPPRRDVSFGKDCSLHQCRDGKPTQMVPHPDPAKKGMNICPKCNSYLLN